MPAPLSTVRVIALGGAAAIAYAGKLFSDLGAEVTRIRNDAATREMFMRAHILLCGSTESDEAALFDPHDLVRECPNLVIASVTPFGLQGEKRAWGADDLTLQAYGGISIGIGLPAEPPLKLPGNQTAYQAGLSAAIAAMSALFSGRGVLLDIAAADVWASFYSGVDVALAHFGRHKKSRSGHRVSGQPYPRTIFPCKDGYFAIQCGESRHWHSFLRMLKREDLLSHPLFANRFKANDEHGDACDALIEPWFLARTKKEILRECLEHKIPGAPVYDTQEVVGHPHLRDRGYFPKRNVYASFVNDTTRTHTRRVHTPRNEAPKLRPLSGFRVIDFGWVWAGAVPGHILADLGAEVIKVESANPLDYMRQGRPIVGIQKHPDQNPMFQNVNRGKLSLRIKLDHPEAKGVLTDLIATSDIVIENFSPGVMQKFGLSYREIESVRRDLVMCSMSAVGQAGPLCGIRTYATMISSLAGLDSLVGYADGRVLGSQSSYADPNASLHAVLGILAALWRRDHSGEGAFIDFSQWEAAVNVMGEQIVEYELRQHVDVPRGTYHASKAPYGNYPCSGEDAWIAIAVATDEQWHVLRTSLDSPEWMLQIKFSTSSGRCANHIELNRKLGIETRRFEARTLALSLAAMGVPAAPLLDASGIAAAALFRERELFEMVEHPILGTLPVYRLPWHIDGAPVPITCRAPCLGEHNEFALGSVLGYTKARIELLTEAGLFQ